MRNRKIGHILKGKEMTLFLKETRIKMTMGFSSETKETRKTMKNSF